MSEPTKIAELLKKGTKLITCKSGNVYKIRKMPLPAMATFFNSIDIKMSKSVDEMKVNMQDQMSDPGKTEKLILAMRNVLPHCIVEPKVTSTEASTETIVSIDDLPIDDIFELFGVITEFSGFSSEKLAANETFRPESNR